MSKQLEPYLVIQCRGCKQPSYTISKRQFKCKVCGKTAKIFHKHGSFNVILIGKANSPTEARDIVVGYTNGMIKADGKL